MTRARHYVGGSPVQFCALLREHETARHRFEYGYFSRGCGNRHLTEFPPTFACERPDLDEEGFRH